MSKKLNNYGDEFRPTKDGHGVDISSQRQDELDLGSLSFIHREVANGNKIHAVDLGGGYGSHSINMAVAGAKVTMLDISDSAKSNFIKAIKENSLPKENLTFIKKDFANLSERADCLPEEFQLLYSQRAFHYVPYKKAKKVLTNIFNKMASNGAIYISVAGYDTEYGLTHRDREKPVEERFDYVSKAMQEKHGIKQKIVIYRQEDLRKLLKDVGFRKIKVKKSEFGNIKATARKFGSS